MQRTRVRRLEVDMMRRAMHSRSRRAAVMLAGLATLAACSHTPRKDPRPRAEALFRELPAAPGEEAFDGKAH